MVTAIVVKLELGHVAQVRDIPTLDGHTHDWMVFVKGAEGIDIEHFVEKVVFFLHESYSPSKHVIKSPPYEVRQTGYAGFNILIEVYFKNKTDPKKVEFNYDMFLHMENMPPVNNTRIEMLTFTSPADDFKRKLLKAGGIVKGDPSQSSSKRSKENRHSDKMRPATKDGSEASKKSRSSEKSHKKSSKEDSHKRRSSISDADSLKKKKKEEKLNATIPLEKKPKEKLNKIKIKLEKGGQPSLFSREESIDMKQIRKKDIPKKEDVKKLSKNRQSPVHVKLKREPLEISEKHPEKKKKDKKSSLESLKIKQGPKQKKRRTMSSSDSEPTASQPSSKSFYHNSDEESRPGKKRSKSERSSKEHKRSSKVKLEAIPHPVDNTDIMDMDISHTPPHPSAANSNNIIVQPPTHIISGDKDKRHKSSKKEKKESSSSKSCKESRSPTKKHKKEKSTSKRSLQHKSQPPPNFSKKPVLTPTREMDFNTSSDSSSDSEDEKAKSRFSVRRASPVVSNPGSPLSTPPFVPKPADDVLSDDSVVSPASSHPQSESEGELFEASQIDVEKHPTHQSASPNVESVDCKIGSPLVAVSVGSEAKKFPGLTQEIFEQLQQLHNALAQINDMAVVSKISSIVKKTGKYHGEGEMNFDLCALDPKTIRKIKKQLKVS